MILSKMTIIDAPASLVFEILMDVDFATRWVPNLISYETISTTPNWVGSTYRSLYNQQGIEFEQISEIKDYVENLSVRWEAITPFANAIVEYYLTSISETQTELKHKSEIQYKGFSRFYVWLMKSKMRKASEGILTQTHENLKTLIEETFESASSYHKPFR